MMYIKRFSLILMFAALMLLTAFVGGVVAEEESDETAIIAQTIASGLDNPRGVAIMPDGRARITGSILRISGFAD